MEDTPDAKIVATISFPIKRIVVTALGCYIIYQEPDGDIDSKWSAEQVIQTSFDKETLEL